MARLSGYLTAGEVQTAGPLPDPERKLALAEFEGVEQLGSPAGSVLAAYPEGNLDRADLSGANLSGWQLRGGNLREADLSGANLRQADLSRANLSGANLSTANLSGANLSTANLSGANLSRGNLLEADLSGANLRQADLSRANLSGANLRRANLLAANLLEANLNEANLFEANFSRADLGETNLNGANLSGANFSSANLRGADLVRASLVRTVLTGADLTGCRIYGVSAWDLQLEGAKQQNLVITPEGEPTVTVDNIEVAQFIYLMLNNQKIRDVIDSLPSKVVLILGRFTDERKAILDAVREELRKHNYVPILFDFDVPATRAITETILLLARMARFIIADLTDPTSIPKELEYIVPDLAVPVQPMLEGGSRAYAMFKDYWKFDWVLPVYRYEGLEALVTQLAEKVIAPAEAKIKALQERRRLIEADLTKPSS